MLRYVRGQLENLAPHFIKENLIPIVLFLGLLFVQFLLRFQGLTSQPIWHDEIATIFFANHLDLVFLGESHTFFYYSLFGPFALNGTLEVGDYRLYQSILSWILSILIVIRSSKLLESHEWFFFNSVYGIHPLVFGFSRIVRPYSLVIDLTTLLIIESRLGSKRGFFFSSLFLSLIYPLAIVPSFVEAIAGIEKKNKLKLAFFSTLPIIVYYAIKLSLDERGTSYIAWIKATTYNFIFRFNDALAGVNFPLNNVPSFWGSLIIFFLFLFFLRLLLSSTSMEVRNAIKALFIIYFGVLLGAEILNPLLNLKIVRYYVFVFPFLLFALSKLVPKLPLARNIFMLFFVSVFLSYSIFKRPYFKMDKSLGSLLDRLTLVTHSSHLPVMICGHRFYQWYLKSRGYLTCSSDKDIELFQSSKEGILVTIQGSFSEVHKIKREKSLFLIESFDDGSIFFLGQ